MKQRLRKTGRNLVIVLLAGCLVTSLAPNATANAAADVPRFAELGLDTEAIAAWVGETQLVLAAHPRTHRVEGPKGATEKDVRFYTAMTVINAKPAQVRARLQAFEDYPDFMDGVDATDIKATDASAQTWDVKLEIKLDFEIISLSTKYRADYRVDGNDLVWQSTDGDLVGSIGRWEFLPLSEDRTLLVYTTYTNYDDTGFILGLILKAQPDLELALPASLGAVAVQSVKAALEDDAETPPTTRSPEIPLFTKGHLPIETARELAARGTLIIAFPEQTLAAKDQKVPLVFVAAGGLVDAPPAAVKQLSTSLPRYSEFFPQVQRVRVERANDKRMLAHWRLGIDFGALKVPVDYINEYRHIAPDAMVFRRVRGDIEFIYGGYEWIPAGDDKTLFFFTAAAAAGENGSRMVKLSQLAPNSEMILGISSSAIILEKQIPWIEQQVRRRP